MKKIFLGLGLLSFVLLSASCEKDRNCRCTTTDELEPTTIVIHVDRSMKCKHITQQGFEEQVEGVFVRQLHTVTCEEIKDR